MTASEISTRDGRADDIPAIAEILVTSWRHTFRSLLPRDFLDSMSVDHQRSRHERMFPIAGVTYRVAVDGTDHPIGFASGGPSRQQAFSPENEVYAIYLLPAFLHKGIGRRLFLRVTDALAGSGRRGLVVMALTANPNLTFYKELGGTRVAAADIQLGDNVFAQTAFIWPNLPVTAP